MNHTKQHFDCYSARDRALMRLSQRQRARWLRGVPYALKQIGLTANLLTGMSLVVGLFSCLALPFYPWLAMVLLGLHAILDGLDGPLARHTKSASEQGSLADTMADLVVVAATTLTLVHLHYLNGLIGGVYVFSYTLVIVFSVVRNALNIPYWFLIRPRFLVYAWIGIDIYLWPGTLDWVAALSGTALTIWAAAGFFAIRNKVKTATQRH